MTAHGTGHPAMGTLHRQARPLLGTLVSIEAEADSDVAGPALRHAFERVAQIHAAMSFHEPGSDLRQLAAARPGTELDVSLDTHAVLTLALALEQASAGAFNVCCARELVNRGLLPCPDEARPHAAPTLGQAIELLPAPWLRVRQTAWIDLGGIAKGYAVDAAVDALRLAGIRTGQVNAGGDLRVFGSRVQAVSVRDPRQPTALRPLAEITDMACATSAWPLARSPSWAHLVAQDEHPQGEPARHPMSVTVLAPTCVIADALTKIVWQGRQLARPLLAEYGASAWLWYDNDHTAHL